MNNSALEAYGKEFKSDNVAKRVLGTKVSPIKEMRIIAQDYNNVISFGQGIPYPDTPTIIKEKLSKMLIEKDISKYTVSPGLLELREKLSKKLSRLGITADQNKEILVTGGAMEGIFCAIMATVNPDDEVILFSPGFSSHIEQVRLAGGKPIFSFLKEKDWGIDIDDFKKKITKKTKAVIVSNPNNPTGSLYSKKDLIQIAKLAKENNIIIISDDPYNFLVYEGEYFSIASIPDMKENIIACFSFSKEYAMTGYRIGYAFATEGMLNQMMKIHDACCICASSLSQNAAIFALDSPIGTTDGIKKALDENRKMIMNGLNGIKGLSYVEPKGAYYIFVKYEKKADSVSLAIDILKKVQVEVVPGSAFGPNGERHIRLAFGCRPEKIKEGLLRLKKYFENVK